MFGTLLYFGGEIYQAAPPIPATVRSAGGQTLFTRADIERGQNVWQSIGGMQQGSIWGHGSYVAPDWSADWLHREAVALLELLARNESGQGYDALAAPEQARLKSILQRAMRTNTYDAAADVVTVSDDRARAIGSVALHYSDLFEGRSTEAQRAAGAVRVPARRRADGTGSRRAQRILLLDGMGRGHGTARRLDHLHEQLAARAARRQHADGRGVHVDLHLDLRAARRASARSSGTTRRSSTSGAATASRNRLRAPGFHERDRRDAVDARDAVVLHGRHGAVRRSGRCSAS